MTFGYVHKQRKDFVSAGCLSTCNHIPDNRYLGIWLAVEIGVRRQSDKATADHEN